MSRAITIQAIAIITTGHRFGESGPYENEGIALNRRFRQDMHDKAREPDGQG